ncbi:hypothetical protein EVAR_93096_1 [Eumeta japonica]|uniref:Uncharacterized protein n=1 Tax=Eumeta variegata TaxID=151549 RepID=A0A4C1TF29_EUMVA|nr:hypothetical protein EVAR_93096_1 [Eumeta japonica]
MAVSITIPARCPFPLAPTHDDVSERDTACWSLTCDTQNLTSKPDNCDPRRQLSIPIFVPNSNFLREIIARQFMYVCQIQRNDRLAVITAVRNSDDANSTPQKRKLFSSELKAQRRIPGHRRSRQCVIMLIQVQELDKTRDLRSLLRRDAITAAL